MENTGKRVLLEFSLAKQRCELPKLSFTRWVAAAHQVMGQQPGLCVENSLVLPFVVFRRRMGATNEPGQRHERFRSQNCQMAFNRVTDARRVGADDFEGGINLRHALLE